MKLRQNYPAWQKVLLYIFNHQRYREVRAISRYPQDYENWEKSGRPLPPPSVVKHRAIKEYARDYACPVFIETGTYTGETVEAMLSIFERIHTIEIDPDLHRRVVKKFGSYPHVSLYCGDSATLLPGILATLEKPSLFWLDGHYSGGTMRSDKITPVMEEVSLILNHRIKNHVLLIDDARLFNGSDGYPQLEDLVSLIRRFDNDMAIDVHDDIIRVSRKG